MPVTLYEHNRSAYEAAFSMMENTGKAAVIHPTGTGKSFLAFQLCQDHPKDTVCWLSPSEYIFRTQEEEWNGAGGRKPANIRFYTYARLMTMSHSELRTIQPGYIILDEFHRCGARMWGQGVQRLLTLYPNVPLLGLSATSIRYLDSQRDMAQELFQGSIASEMTLGEAVAQGILNPPEYVLSVFPYEQNFKEYEDRVRLAKNKAVREAAGKALEALRRTLEQAQGLEDIFAKHMTDDTGKYLVFCANYKHMQEMMGKVPEWFQKVDRKPHVYAVYSGDPQADQAFQEFKADRTSHLKLLFCIDMLNEGIHVEGISGVILLRPTVSPIIYKQQIGRALSAGAGKCSVIFDVVQNIENLSGIGALEEEVREAAAAWRQDGRKKEFFQYFHVTDEAKDCLRLFRELEETLGSSWEMMYQAAQRYYREHKNLEVPKRYKTPEGLSLGAWLDTQRKVYHGKAPGRLSRQQMECLTSIGMQWQGARERAWERNFQEAQHYYQTHGDLLAGARETSRGIALGAWLAQLRMTKKEGKSREFGLTPEQEEALNAIGMVWDVPKYQWEMYYQAAEWYYQEHGNLNVPASYVTQDGIKLGTWVIRQRRMKREAREKASGESWAKEQISRLEAIGMIWEAKRDNAWERAYCQAKIYREEHGSLDIPASYVTKEGIHLGKWIRRQQEAYKDAMEISDNTILERRRKLEAIGMVWKKEDLWEQKYALAKNYLKEHGSLDMPQDTVIEGVWLARWLKEQKARLGKEETAGPEMQKKLTPEQLEKLKSLGIEKETNRHMLAWQRQYEEARRFYQERGHLHVPILYPGAEGRDLGSWLKKQRAKQRAGKLKQEQVVLLEEIGISWDGKASKE